MPSHHNAPMLISASWCKYPAISSSLSNPMKRNRSHVGQNPSRATNAAWLLAALYHRSSRGSPSSCLPSTSTQLPVDAFHNSVSWYSSNEVYHFPKTDLHLCISWGIEMKSPSWSMSQTLTSDVVHNSSMLHEDDKGFYLP